MTKLPTSSESLLAQTSWLRRLAAELVGNVPDAEDLTQDTVLAALTAQSPDRAKIRTWLRGIARNLAAFSYRSESRRRRHEHGLAELSAEEVAPSAADVCMQFALHSSVVDAVMQLEGRVRSVLLLRFWEDLSAQEIARQLGEPVETVRTRIKLGIAQMRRRLDVEHGDRRIWATALLGNLRTQTAAVASPSTWSGILAMGIPTRLVAITVVLVVACIWAGLFSTDKVEPGSAIGFARTVVGGLAQDATGAPEDLRRPERATVSRQAVDDLDDGVTEPVVVGGTLRDENGEPIAFADVYLAMIPMPDKDLLGRMGSFLRDDYFKRSHFLQTKTDKGGRYLFERIRAFGNARLGAFKVNYSDPRTAGSRGLATLKIETGTERTDIDLVMAAGKTLTGKVIARDGSPVVDAVVTVYSAWTQTDHIFWPAGLGPTDVSGRFQLGFAARAAGCHLRINSAKHGQGFFLEVPVKEDDVELTLKEAAQIEGTITWEDGTPASGLTVRVNGRLPEPPIAVSRMGMRPHVVHDGLVGDQGAYKIEGLHPQLRYDIFIIDGSLGEQEARKKPLTPRLRNSFRLAPGESKVWNHAVAKPITVRGYIRTETTAAPVLEAQVGVRKDGKRLALLSVWTDKDGFFELRLQSGPGEYRFHAEPPVGFATSEEVANLIDARFGKTVEVSSSKDVEVDLTIFEPAVFPVRVLDHAGEPINVIRNQLHVTFPNGEKLHHETSTTLDETGRACFLHYYPATEFWYEISAHANGPTARTRRYASVPGTVLPEETIVLPRTCQLSAALVDEAGKPHKERWVRLRVIYEDGSETTLTSRTDKQGKLNEKGRVKAAVFVVELRSAGSEVMWKSQRQDGGAESVVDLGNIILEWRDG